MSVIVTPPFSFPMLLVSSSPRSLLRAMQVEEHAVEEDLPGAGERERSPRRPGRPLEVIVIEETPLDADVAAGAAADAAVAAVADGQQARARVASVHAAVVGKAVDDALTMYSTLDGPLVGDTVHLMEVSATYRGEGG